MDSQEIKPHIHGECFGGPWRKQWAGQPENVFLVWLKVFRKICSRLYMYMHDVSML